MQLENVLDIASRSDAGRVRLSNEDCVGHDSALGIVALADGIGGHPGGEVASAIAVDTVLRHLKVTIPHLAPAGIRAAAGYTSESAVVRQAISHANETIFNTAAAQSAYQGMGTTLVTAIFYDDRLTVANVGDSRLYRFRGDRLAQITVDHSLLQALIDKGLCALEQVRTSMNKNLVTRAVGTEPTVKVDMFEDTVTPNDLYLLCSDGLNDMLDDTGICQIVRTFGADLNRTAERLIARANENGGKDNISVILVRPSKPFPADKR